MESKTIAVHSETFHADDAMAVYLLQHTKEFKNAKIVRTRKQEIIEKCDAVADVGCVYDHNLRRYDHHQQSYDVKFPGSQVLCASAGLVYIHYGREVIQNLATELELSIGEELDFVYNAMYFNMIQEIDGIDNGVPRVTSNQKKRYSISSDITSRIAMLNPSWNDPNPEPDKQFIKAIQLIREEFESLLKYIIKFWLDGFPSFRKAFETRFDYDKSGKIIYLGKNKFVDFYLSQVNDDLSTLFIIYINDRDMYSVKTLSYPNQPFRSRKLLPFAGKSPDLITEQTGIKDVVFSHKAGFLTVLKTEESAHKFASFAVDYAEEEKEQA